MPRRAALVKDSILCLYYLQKWTCPTNWKTCCSSSDFVAKCNSEHATAEENRVHAEVFSLCSCLLPEFCPLWESWSLTLHGLSPFLFFPLSLSLSRPLLTILSAFLALSSLLIYRIMHQKSLWGVAVMQAAAPSGFALFLTTIFDQLEAPHHVFSLSYKHTKEYNLAYGQTERQIRILFHR